MLKTNDFIFFFIIAFHMVTKAVILRPEASSDDSSAQSYRVNNQNEHAKAKKPWFEELKGFSNKTKTTVNDVATKMSDVYHDTGIAADNLRRSVARRIEHEVNDAYQEVVPTLLGVPYQYYMCMMLFAYAKETKLRDSVRIFAGSIFLTFLIGHFVRYVSLNLSDEKKMPIKDSKRRINAAFICDSKAF